jgi:hypothetical protein
MRLGFPLPGNPNGMGQQFFHHLPSSATRNGARRFTSVARRQSAWERLPDTWAAPFHEADRDGGHQWNATPPGARESVPIDDDANRGDGA